MKKIRIAFVKFGGMAAGGTEKFLQTVAANLPKDLFEVTYFYCDATPLKYSSFKHPDTDIHRLHYMEDHHVKLVKFHVGCRDDSKRTMDWIDTDFWNVFNENDYDLIQTGRAGFPEYPFNKIHKTPIIDSLHLLAGVDNQFNISRVMHITKWSARKWTRMGGDKKRIVLVSHPMEINFPNPTNLREQYNLEHKFIYGFHQRNDNNIFSPIPLEAYKKIETAETYFMLMGGGDLYRKQAKDLEIKNCIFIEHSGDTRKIYEFLSTLNVYAHGRKDGEVNSTAMAEAMYFGLPIVSHTSKINNGHIECIGDAGSVAKNINQYISELSKLNSDRNFYILRSQNAKRRFAEKYELQSQMHTIEKIYHEAIANPFPSPIRRKFYSLRLRYFLLYTFVRIAGRIKREIKARRKK